jgi:hypothetical protein
MALLAILSAVAQFVKLIVNSPLWDIIEELLSAA